MEFIKSENLKYEYMHFNEESNKNEAVEALKGLDLSVEKGEFVAVLGHNGSGKSTFAKLINGIYSPKAGVLVVDGYDTNIQENIWNIRRNVGMVFQNPDNQIIATVVEEDVAFGPENLGMEPKVIAKNVDKALHAVSMEEFRHSAPNFLSGGQKQRVAIAGILAMTPQCIIFDEPTAMLDPLGRKEVMDTILDLHRQGITIVLITHYMEEAALSDRIVVMNNGLKEMEGTPKQIFSQVEKMKELGLDVPQVTELVYRLNKMGRNFKRDILSINDFISMADKNGYSSDFSMKEEIKDYCMPEKILEVKNLTHTYGKGTAFESVALENVNIEIGKGEFIGLIGHTGSGKSTLIEHLNGLIRAEEGNIYFKGKDIFENKADLKHIREKIGLVFQYPEHQIFESTIFDEVAFGPKNMGLEENEVKRRVKQAIELVGLNEDCYKKSPFDLSGGQKRRVAIAGVLAMEPEILVLDEPMAGLDPKGRGEILSNIKEMHSKLGITIILVSHSMEEIADLADRILVMNRGKVEMFDTVEKVFSQVERLLKIGLNAPEISLLMYRLKQRGLKVPANIYNVEKAAYILNQALRM